MAITVKLPPGIPQELEWWLVKWMEFSDTEIQNMFENKKDQITTYVAECKAESKDPGNYGYALKQMYIILHSEMKRRSLL